MLVSVEYEPCLKFGGIFSLKIEVFFSDNITIAIWIESISLCSLGRFWSLGFGYILYVNFCRLWSVVKCWMYLSSFCLRGKLTRIVEGLLELTGSCVGKLNCQWQSDVYVLLLACSCGSFQGYRRCTNFEAIQVQGVSTFFLPWFALLLA